MNTTMYSAYVEIDTTKYDVDDVMAQLEVVSGAVGQSARGYAFAQISIPAVDLRQAAALAIAEAERAFGAPAVACEVLTEAEHDARQGWTPVPELLSVTEAAELLGVSRQRVLQLIAAKTLPSTKIGRDHAIPRDAVTARAGRA